MYQVDKTLAEQMQINDREIGQRKQLLDFTTVDVDVLVKHKQFIANRIDVIVERFYARQVEHPEIALLIGDAETLRRLRGAMRRYILELFDGYYDYDYVNRRLRIGKVHKRIGVSPKLYISAIWLLQSVLVDEISGYYKEKPRDESESLKQALNKLLMLDTQFVFDTYIGSLVTEVEMAKNELENYVESLEEVVAKSTQHLHDLSRRDSLTELFNQRAFFENLRREIAFAERHHDTLSLVYLDLNGFKALNDAEGHQAGDKVLVEVGEALMEACRETDYPCRYGGDEFAVILPITTLDEAKVLSQRLIDVFKDQQHSSISFSIGIAKTGPEEFIDHDTLLKQADEKMYESKALSKEEPDFYITV